MTFSDGHPVLGFPRKEVVVPISPDRPPLQPGRVSTFSIDVENTTVDAVAFIPEHFTADREFPVLLALPPGGQDLGIAESILRAVYLANARAGGWVVVSPAAPGGSLFFRGSERLIPGFLDHLEQWMRPERGTFHLVGMSNGGISAFRIAGQSPDRFASMLVFPGYPSSAADRVALARLTGIPIAIYVGERDTEWVQRGREAYDRLTQLGGEVMLEVVAGEGHVIGALANGSRIFDWLEAARPSP